MISKIKNIEKVIYYPHRHECKVIPKLNYTSKFRLFLTEWMAERMNYQRILGRTRFPTSIQYRETTIPIAAGPMVARSRTMSYIIRYTS